MYANMYLRRQCARYTLEARLEALGKIWFSFIAMIKQDKGPCVLPESETSCGPPLW